jgi:hypothetical protein
VSAKYCVNQVWGFFRFLSTTIAVFFLLFGFIQINAQDDSDDGIVVPNVGGLTLAQAAAELNRVGLLLGSVDYANPVSDDEIEPEYMIVGQSPDATEMVDEGTTVDVTLNFYNVLLRYDGNEFHLINRSGVDISLYNLSFETDARLFEARRWGDVSVKGNCVQVWSISIDVSRPYEPDECNFVQGRGGVIANTAENQQFWIDSEAETFLVKQNGMIRAECPIAADSAEGEPLDTCEVWLASNQPPQDITEYLYFVYDAHNFYVHNRSISQWMPLASIALVDTTRSLVETRFFNFEPRGNTDFLAPSQCLLITDGTPPAENAEPLAVCNVIVQSTYASADRFWINGFSVDGVLNVPSQRMCPPVVDDERSICLLPR